MPFGSERCSLSIIVPAYNNAEMLARCLHGLISDADGDCEIIVVDDASDDETGTVATRHNVKVLRLKENVGPGPARNYGARHSSGEILFFVDADVVIAPGTLKKAVQSLLADSSFAAVFGSYDAQPGEPDTVSQYRNLLHHFVHQTAAAEASHFWAGLGAIRREAFFDVGGYDEQRFARAIEDVELGYRLREKGYTISLNKELQCKHLKKWSLGSIFRTDVTLRAIPWVRLMLEYSAIPGDFSLGWSQRLSLVAVWFALCSLVLSVVQPQLLIGTVLSLVIFLVLNRSFFAFLLRSRGIAFLARCTPLHFLYYVNSGIGLLLGIASYSWERLGINTIIRFRGIRKGTPKP
jgi:GT2 family glycosyltransferase